MKKADVLEYFGSATAAARAIRISRSAVCQWGEFVPELSARRYAEVTDGALAFDPGCYYEPEITSGPSSVQAS